MPMHKLAEELPAATPESLVDEVLQLDPVRISIDGHWRDDQPLINCLYDDESKEEADDPSEAIHPRSQRCFYKTILKGMRIWQRPPENVCKRCTRYELYVQEEKDLTHSVNAIPGTPDYDKHQARLKQHGGLAGTYERLRRIRHALIDLRRHVTWRANQRDYLHDRKKNMSEHEIILELDYGGFSDSANDKISVWSCTAIIQDGVKHIDYFFDAYDKKTGTGHKKDGEAGIYFLDQLFNPEHGPGNGGVSLIHTLFPNRNSVILSGDTGNGFRAYLMLHFLSTLFVLYGWRCELIPLSPGHAFNQSDARIARINTFMRRVMRKTRVLGAEMTANLMAVACDPTRAKRREYMKNTHVFFRVVDVGGLLEGITSTTMGATMESIFGRLGVRALLYFQFGVKVGLPLSLIVLLSLPFSVSDYNLSCSRLLLHKLPSTRQSTLYLQGTILSV